MKIDFRMAILASLLAATNGIGLAQQPTPGDQSTQGQEQSARKSTVRDVPPQVSQEKRSTSDSSRGVVEQSKDPQEKAEINGTDEAKGGANAGTKASHGAPLSDEEAGITPYYNNFFETYRLGPEDVISVSVFGQDRYSKSGIIIPPNGRISYPLVAEGVLVAGRTVEEVAATLTKRLDEYIIDPKITVSLDKAASYRYSVVGEVAQPGIKIMGRRLTVTEALAEAGGVLPTGSKSKIFVLRRGPAGNLDQIPVNVYAIYKHRAPDIVTLRPGDQVIVPGNHMKRIDKIISLLPILGFARIFTGGY